MLQWRVGRVTGWVVLCRRAGRMASSVSVVAFYHCISPVAYEEYVNSWRADSLEDVMQRKLLMGLHLETFRRRPENQPWSVH